jgi:hypothetical protein
LDGGLTIAATAGLVEQGLGGPAEGQVRLDGALEQRVLSPRGI